MQTPAFYTGEKAKISVWLDDSEKDKKSLKAFHCLVCGHVVFEYYNNVRLIVPGEQAEGKSPKVVQCQGTITVFKGGERITTRCKTKYWIE